MTIENFGQRVLIDNVQYRVENVRALDDGDFYVLDISLENALLEEEFALHRLLSPPPLREAAEIAGGRIVISETTTTETKPIDALPIAAGIGIAMGLITLAVWIGYRQIWGGDFNSS